MASGKTETIRERLVREEREEREKRMAEVKAEREARELAMAEAEERRRNAEAEAAERRRLAEEQAREKAAADAAARKERNAKRRKEEIDKLERQYVLFERAVAMMDELEEAERNGLNAGVTYLREVEKLRGTLVYNRDSAKQYLLNPADRFRYLGIDE